MNEKDLISLDQVASFLDGTQAVAFTVLSDKDDRYKGNLAYAPKSPILSICTSAAYQKA